GWPIPGTLCCRCLNKHSPSADYSDGSTTGRVVALPRCLRAYDVFARRSGEDRKRLKNLPRFQEMNSHVALADVAASGRHRGFAGRSARPDRPGLLSPPATHRVRVDDLGRRLDHAVAEL